MKKLGDMTEPELRYLMNRLAKAIEVAAELLEVERPRFALVVFSDPKIGQYVANCSRASMIEALDETVQRLRKLEDIPR